MGSTQSPRWRVRLVFLAHDCWYMWMYVSLCARDDVLSPYASVSLVTHGASIIYSRVAVTRHPASLGSEFHDNAIAYFQVPNHETLPFFTEEDRYSRKLSIFRSSYFDRWNVFSWCISKIEIVDTAINVPSVGCFWIADGQASYCLVRERRRRRRCYRASTSMRSAKICRRVSDTLLFLYKFFISLEHAHTFDCAITGTKSVARQQCTRETQA